MPRPSRKTPPAAASAELTTPAELDPGLDELDEDIFSSGDEDEDDEIRGLNDPRISHLPPTPMLGGGATRRRDERGAEMVSYGRAIAPPMWAEASRHPTVTQFRVFRIDNGVPVSIGYIDAQATEDDFIRTFKSSFDNPALNRHTFRLQPIDINGQDVGKEITKVISDDHITLNQIRNAKKGAQQEESLNMLPSSNPFPTFPDPSAPQQDTTGNILASEVSRLFDQALNAKDHQAQELMHSLAEERERLRAMQDDQSRERMDAVTRTAETMQSILSRTMQDESQRSASLLAQIRAQTDGTLAQQAAQSKALMDSLTQIFSLTQTQQQAMSHAQQEADARRIEQERQRATQVLEEERSRRERDRMEAEKSIERMRVEAEAARKAEAARLEEERRRMELFMQKETEAARQRLDQEKTDAQSRLSMEERRIQAMAEAEERRLERERDRQMKEERDRREADERRESREREERLWREKRESEERERRERQERHELEWRKEREERREREDKQFQLEREKSELMRQQMIRESEERRTQAEREMRAQQDQARREEHERAIRQMEMRAEQERKHNETILHTQQAAQQAERERQERALSAEREAMQLKQAEANRQHELMLKQMELRAQQDREHAERMMQLTRLEHQSKSLGGLGDLLPKAKELMAEFGIEPSDIVDRLLHGNGGEGGGGGGGSAWASAIPAVLGSLAELGKVALTAQAAQPKAPAPQPQPQPQPQPVQQPQIIGTLPPGTMLPGGFAIPAGYEGVMVPGVPLEAAPRAGVKPATKPAAKPKPPPAPAPAPEEVEEEEEADTAVEDTNAENTGEADDSEFITDEPIVEEETKKDAPTRAAEANIAPRTQREVRRALRNLGRTLTNEKDEDQWEGQIIQAISMNLDIYTYLRAVTVKIALLEAGVSEELTMRIIEKARGNALIPEDLVFDEDNVEEMARHTARQGN